MDTPPTQGFVLELWHAGVAIASAAVVGAWRFVTGNIADLKTNSMTKVEFKEYAERAQVQRDELREAVIKLFDGQTKIADDLHDTQKVMTDTINAHYGELLKAIHEVKK